MIKALLNNRVCSICIILLLTLAAYSNIFPNDFVLDDFDFIVYWPLIQDWNNLPQFFLGYTPPAGQEGIFSPLKTLVHAINYHLFGLNPLGHHIFSIIVHSTAVFFVYQLSHDFTKNRTVAFLSALFFGLHPVHAGVVSSMTGSVDVLGMLFLFVSFYLYVKAQEQGAILNQKYYIGSLIAAFVAIFSHELTLSLPLLCIWYNLCFLRKKVHWKRTLLRTIPFFAIAVFYVLCKFLTLKAVARGGYIYDSFYWTMLVMIKALAKYIYICFFPLTLTHNHVIAKGIFSFATSDFDQFAVLSQSIYDLNTLISLILLGGIFYCAWSFRKKQPLLPFCIGWFFISLSPSANIIPSSVYFAERYLYPGSWAFCLLLAFYLSSILDYGKETRNEKLLFWSAIFVIVLITAGYLVRTWMRAADFRDQITLHETAVKTNPQSALLRSDLGLVYTQYQMPQKAIASFNESLKIKPVDPVTYFALAEVYIQMKNYETARENLELAITLDPQYADAYYNLAGLYAILGLPQKSREYLDQSLEYFREQGRSQEADQNEQSFKAYFGSLNNEQP